MTIQVVTIERDELNDIIAATARRAAEETLARAPKPGVRPSQITYKQAAELLGLSPQTVSKMVRAGTIKLNKFGTISMEEIDRALQTRSEKE